MEMINYLIETLIKIEKGIINNIHIKELNMTLGNHYDINNIEKLKNDIFNILLDSTENKVAKEILNVVKIIDWKTSDKDLANVQLFLEDKLNTYDNGCLKSVNEIYRLTGNDFNLGDYYEYRKAIKIYYLIASQYIINNKLNNKLI